MQVSNRGIKRQLLQKVKQCELCGNDRNLEVHHIIPLCCGGEDSIDNMIVVCSTCHAKLTPKSQLTKLGIKRCREKQDKILKFYTILNEFEGDYDVHFILDLVDNLWGYSNDIR